MKLLPIFLLMTSLSAYAQDYALDDAHNHDGTHVEGQENCGTNYMLPGETARLGSHSFLVLGEDGPDHLLLDHRSGTPPHTYQFILRVRVDANEMATYRKLLSETKIALPAVTTIYFDKSGKQVDRTFFCLTDLKKIFGPEQKKGDPFEKLFPIRASWQKNADFEGAFPIKETVVPEDPLVIERKDVEIVLYRYLPSYLEQTSLRKALKTQGAASTSNLSGGPGTSYIRAGAHESNGETCRSDYYLKNVRLPKTKHAFLLLAESGPHTVLAAHLYDQSPQNYQTTLQLELPNEQMKLFRKARNESKAPPLFMSSDFFCMADIKELIKSKSLNLKGTLYKNSDYEDFKPGEPVGELNLASYQTKVLVNRTLQSLLNPQAVARDVFGIVDVKTVSPAIQVQAAYATDWNFIGQPIIGYRSNKCYLTGKAAKALGEVQKDVSRLGYSLLAFDCYRPQRAVNQFVSWVKGGESKMQASFYPEEKRGDLIKRGYIDDRSGHSRASTIDLTLVRTDKFKSDGFVDSAKKVTDCRKSKGVETTGQLDMGTTFDCFSELAHTANSGISEEARKNREILKAAMEKQGFKNYPKEWWHFVLKDEAYKSEFFDFEVE